MKQISCAADSLPPFNAQPTICLEIVCTNEGEYRIIPRRFDPDNDAGMYMSRTFNCSPNDLANSIAECIDIWHQSVVFRQLDHPTPNYKPFQNRTNLHDFENDLETDVKCELAVAGFDLFKKIFGDPYADAIHDDARDPNYFARKIYDAMSQEQSIVFWSRDCLIPWGMIYTHPFSLETNDVLDPSGNNGDWKGFWGFSHLIDHRMTDVTLGNKSIDIAIDQSAVPMTVYYDENLAFHCDDGHLHVSKHLAKIDDLDFLSNQNYPKKKDLELRLRKDSCLGTVAYFICHGGPDDDGRFGTMAYVKLTDTRATVQTFRNALGDFKKLVDKPLVFLNLCQGGQMHTEFYGKQSLGGFFIERSARGVIGPQVNMPYVFAQDYGIRFFTKLTSHLSEANGDANAMTVSQIIRDLAQSSIRDESNPLALTYSIYEAGECTLRALGNG